MMNALLKLQINMIITTETKQKYIYISFGSIWNFFSLKFYFMVEGFIPVN